MEKRVQRVRITSFIVVLGLAGYFWANWWGRIQGTTDIVLDIEKYIPFIFNLENKIPFISEAVYIYLLFFPFLLTPALFVKRHSDFCSVAFAYSILLAVSLAIFTQFPTTMARPTINDGGLTGFLLRGVQKFDGPNNLFPSLHVSSVIYMAAVNCYFCKNWRWLNWLFAICIVLSTLLVKQHAIIDVIGGLIFGISAALLFLVINKKRN